MSQVLCQLHQAHQQSSTAQHQTGPQQSKQGLLQRVLPAQDHFPGVSCVVDEARRRGPLLSVQHLFHSLDFSLDICNVHLTFGYVEALWKKRYDSRSGISIMELPVPVGRADCNQWDELQGQKKDKPFSASSCSTDTSDCFMQSLGVGLKRSISYSDEHRNQSDVSFCCTVCLSFFFVALLGVFFVLAWWKLWMLRSKITIHKTELCRTFKYTRKRKGGKLQKPYMSPLMLRSSSHMPLDKPHLVRGSSKPEAHEAVGETYERDFTVVPQERAGLILRLSVEKHSDWSPWGSPSPWGTARCSHLCSPPTL